MIETRTADSHAATGPQTTRSGPLTGSVLGERYSVEGLIGSGTGGHVYVAFDRSLMRRVALKTLRARFAQSFEQRQRFLIEARRMSSLDHPGIPSVFDIGMGTDGSPYFTMTLVRGQSLQHVLRGMRERSAEGSAESDWTLTRLLQALIRIAETLDFAHHRGLIHRDLKPANIGVGDHGEVYVLDWGLAKRVKDDPLAQGAHASVHILAKTVNGAVKGTPLYMSPEQARGQMDRLDPRTDVFALGAILYEILTLQPPYRATSLDHVMREAKAGRVLPIQEVAAGREVPAALESLTTRALSADLEERPSTAREFADEIQVHLEGERRKLSRRRHVRTYLANALRLVERARKLEARVDDLTAESVRAAGRLETHCSLEERRRVWSLEDRREEASIESTRTLAHAMDLTSRAIAHDPTDSDARELMARLYLHRLRKAVQARDASSAVWLERMVEFYNDGQLDNAIRDCGHAIVTTRPAGAAVSLVHQESRDRRWVDGDVVHLGMTPIATDRLPRGRVVLRVDSGSHLGVRIPLDVTPGLEADLRIDLVAQDECPEGFVHVPAGPYLSGLPGRPTLEECGSFLMARFPVTIAAYREWLESLDEPVRREHVPAVWEELDAPPAGAAGDLPVTDVTPRSARAFVRWWGERHGVAARLPRETEWEKAVRGTDGRLFSWGDTFEPSYCSTSESTDRIEPVGAREADVGPFGVRDLSGGVREICTDLGGGADAYAVRGGSWDTDQRQARAFSRHVAESRSRSPGVGFRIVIDLGAHAAGSTPSDLQDLPPDESQGTVFPHGRDAALPEL